MIYVQALGTDKIANQRVFDVVRNKYRFEKIIVVCSKDSIKFLPENMKPDEVIVVEDENNISEIYSKLENISDEVLVNVTTGTKAMTVALTLLVVKNKGKIVYVGGTRKGEKVMTGSEIIYEYDIR